MVLKESQSDVMLIVKLDADGVTVPLDMLQNAKEIHIDYQWQKDNGSTVTGSWPSVGNTIVYGVDQFASGMATYLRYGFGTGDSVPADGKGWLQCQARVKDSHDKLWYGRPFSIEVKSSIYHPA